MRSRPGSRASRFRSSPAVVALLTVVLWPCAVARAQEPWRPGVYMKEAVAGVMSSARTIADLGEFGYVSGTCFLGAYLEPRGFSSMTVPMEEGVTYLILGGGDSDARDVDIQLVDSRGQVVAKDDDADATPLVEFTPPFAGKYTIRLTLFAADRGSFCATAILRRNGYDVPVRNLVDATVHLIAQCEAVWRAVPGQVGFHVSENQWAVYGAILEQEGSTTITNMDPGTRRLAFVSAGDDIAEDIDLWLLDAIDRTLAEDIDADPRPVIVHNTRAGANYGVRTKVARSQRQGASLVLTAVLEVP
jgi:hypothetical protein